MRKIYKDITELVGNTPMLVLESYSNAMGLETALIGKLEYFNPAGSIKDRVAKNIIEEAEKQGRLKSGSVIVEPTSGNTGIGLAAIGASKGYKVVLVMPETMSIERRKLMLAYGAEIVLTEGSKGMKGAIEKAEDIVKRRPRAILAGQFVNPANPEAHMKSTGKEIWDDTDGEIDILVGTVGTGGTITGTGRYLKEKKPDTKIVAVEPEKSSVLSGGVAGPHKIQGIGAGFVPEVLDSSIYDEVITVSEEEAFRSAKLLGAREGILVGISSGAALSAAVRIASRPENKGKKIVVILPDTGERYLSTEGYIDM